MMLETPADSLAIPQGGALPCAITPLAAWLAVVAFCIAQIVATIDRGMLALVIDPVRHDLGISELQIALLQGFAFAIFYVTMGLPLGVLADIVNRRRLLVGGILVWSVATIGGGLAQSFGGMFASRLCIGVGEAVLAPCAVTMISDLFPASRRGRPMAVYVFGSIIAFGVGSLVSGAILQIAPQGAFHAWPLIGHLAPWRITFVLVGSFGFVVAGMMAMLPEPPRQGASVGPVARTGIREGLAHFWARKTVFIPLYTALAFYAMGASVASLWGAVLLTRRYGFTLGQAGKALGTTQILWAALGAAVAGIAVDRVTRRAGTVGKIRLTIWLSALAIPAVCAVAAPNGTVATVMLAELMFVTVIYGTSMLSVISEVAPLRVRGLSVALYAFVMTLIGNSIGPIAVATLTQSVFRSPNAVGFSMVIVGVVALCLSGIFSFVTARAVGRMSAAYLD